LRRQETVREKTVYYPQEFLDGFADIAHKNRKEIFAYLFGHIAGDEIIICDAYFPPVRATSTQVFVTTREQRRSRDIARKRGLRWIGTIHSHPDGSCLMSMSDYRSARATRETISAIVATFKVGKRRCVQFAAWDPKSPVSAKTKPYRTKCPVCAKAKRGAGQ
jgi:proteasome lid subunit RPN8/RPN11